MTGLVRDLQERAARALPAAHVERDGGWWLRHAPGCGWWVGTVLPHGGVPPDDLSARVARAEAFHARHGTPARFQLTPGACPDGLDAALAARDYRRLGPMSLQVAPAAHVAHRAPVGSLPVWLADDPPSAWLDAWLAVHAGDGDLRAQRAMLDRVAAQSAHACALLDGDVVAVGRAVADGGWAGVFDMATRPEARGRGRGPRRPGRTGRLGRPARCRAPVPAGRAIQRTGPAAVRAGGVHGDLRVPLPHRRLSRPELGVAAGRLRCRLRSA